MADFAYDSGNTLVENYESLTVHVQSAEQVVLQHVFQHFRFATYPRRKVLACYGQECEIYAVRIALGELADGLAAVSQPLLLQDGMTSFSYWAQKCFDGPEQGLVVPLERSGLFRTYLAGQVLHEEERRTLDCVDVF
jgi:hypothetical protein